MTDSDGASISSIVADCDLEIIVSNGENGHCAIDLTEMIESFLNENNLVSIQTKYLYIFQAVQATLFHINKFGMIGNNDTDTEECMYSLFVGVIDVLIDQFGSNDTDLCQSAYVVVCFLTLREK